MNKYEKQFLKAVEDGDLDTLKKLKKDYGSQIDYNITNFGSINALHIASYSSKSLEIVQWLINSCRLDIESMNIMKYTPFLCAARNGHLKNLKLLKSYGASTRAKDARQNNALHLSCKYSNKPETVKWLIDSCRLDIESKNMLHYTPFLWAAEQGQLKILELLKSRGANVKAVNSNGNNALHLSCKYSIKPEIVKWLIKNTYIDINQKNYYSKTPYDITNNKETKELLKNGENIRAASFMADFNEAMAQVDEMNMAMSRPLGTINYQENILNSSKDKISKTDIKELQNDLNFNKTKISELETKLNQIPQTIQNNWPIIEKTIEEQQEKSQEYDYIIQNPKLEEYYNILQRLLNGTFEACRVINSGLVAQNLDTKKSLSAKGIGTLIGKILEKSPIPFSSIITAAIEWSFKRYEKPGINALAQFFSNSIEQSQAIEKLIRQLTIAKENQINKLPIKHIGIKNKLKHLKNKITADDIDGALREYIEKDQKRTLEPIMKKLLPKPYYTQKCLPKLFKYVMNDQNAEYNPQILIINNNTINVQQTTNINTINQEQKETSKNNLETDEIKKLKAEMYQMRKELDRAKNTNQCLQTKIKKIEKQYNDVFPENCVDAGTQAQALLNPFLRPKNMINININTKTIAYQGKIISELVDDFQTIKSDQNEMRKDLEEKINYQNKKPERKYNKKPESIGQLIFNLKNCKCHTHRAKALYNKLTLKTSIQTKLDLITQQLNQRVNSRTNSEKLSNWIAPPKEKLKNNWIPAKNDDYLKILLELENILNNH